MNDLMISEMFSRFFYLFGYLHVLLTKSLYLASVLPNIWFFTSTWWFYDSVPLQITHDRFGFLLLSWKCYSVQITCDSIFLLTLFGCVFLIFEDQWNGNIRPLWNILVIIVSGSYSIIVYWNFAGCTSVVWLILGW